MNCKNVEQLSINEKVQQLMLRSVKQEWFSDDPWKVKITFGANMLRYGYGYVIPFSQEDLVDVL
jgi:hypothetical protein